jgi:uncharacterized protein YgbK (DUF1537 family)
MNLPLQLWLTFYGDDFTGSTDTMEALALAGIRTVLFLEPPQASTLREWTGLGAVGVAGNSRAMTPAEMDEGLPPIFERLRGLGAPLFHYKICSTFDSSPEIGAIGRAIDLGQSVFKGCFVPLVVGVPKLARYCAFGHAFARSGLDSPVYRLDRHPSMRRHPVTPMHESDLRIHLSQQTSRKIGLFDLLDLSVSAEERVQRFQALLRSNAEIILFDILYDEHLPRIGHLIWGQASSESPLFVVGSSGMDYALTACWRSDGLLPEPTSLASSGSVDQLLVISGSCSPVTERQIAWAIAQGFAEVPLKSSRLAVSEEADQDCQTAARTAVEALATGRSVALHTLGLEADSTSASGSAVAQTNRQSKGRALGRSLGRILRIILETKKVRRAVVIGGDTSGEAARELGIESLEMIAPIAPGSPLCRARGPATTVNGMEFVFKGGQVGKSDFLGSVLHGTP